MYQILLQIGPVTIFSLWIMIGIGIFMGLLTINKLTNKARIKLQFLADHSLSIFLFGLILSRLFWVIRNYEIYFYDFSLNSVINIFFIWDKGLSPWGAILGVALAVGYLAHKKGEDWLRWLDVLSVSMLTILAFGNIGTLLDGRNFGRETGLPWGVIIENSIYAVPIHPTQLYAALYCGLLAFGLYHSFQRNFSKKSGNIALIAAGLYSFFRFLEEFLRGDETVIVGPLREAQIVALLALVISAILLYVRNFRKSSNLPS